MKGVHVGGILQRSQNKAAKKKRRVLNIIYVSIPLQFTGDLYQVWGFLEGGTEFKGWHLRGHSNLHVPTLRISIVTFLSSGIYLRDIQQGRRDGR